jgi:FAD binding domain/Berberine and berberine like
MTALTARAAAGTETLIDQTALDTLAATLGDRLIVPGGGQYDDARRVFNGMIDRRPALIARCRGVADVIQSVNFAREHALLVAIRGGAHGIAGFATCDGGIVIDLSDMKGIRLDLARGTVRAEGGATWADLDRETQMFALAVPGGVVSTTGIAGLTLGGGQGWLRRTYGMTCDSLVSADVVTADGKLLSVSETDHSDLFWALRGGGGNFGVVTSFEYRLHPLDPVLAFAAPVYAVDKAEKVLAGLREFVSKAPDEVNANAVLWTLPESPAFPSSLHGHDVIIVGGIYAGPVERGEQVLRPLRELDQPLLDMSSAIPYSALQQLFDPFFPKGEFLHYWKALYLDDLSDKVIEQILARSRQRPSRRSMLSIWAVGGAMARVSADETPLGNRAAPFLLEILGTWKKSEDTAQNVAWARDVFEGMHGFSSGKPNLNFPGLGEDSDQMVRAAYGAHYDRLVAVKNKYDRANLFRLNQNIVPAR